MFTDFDDLFAEPSPDLPKRHYISSYSPTAESFVTECLIEYYGERQLDGEDSTAYIGCVSGWLVSGDQLGYRPEMCDDTDAELGFVVSAMSEDNGLLEMDPYRSFFYIHELKMEDEYNTNKLKLKILQNLAETVLTLYHIYPSLIIVYPEPLFRIKTGIEQIKDDFAVFAAKEMLDDITQSSDEISLSLDEEQFCYLMGQRKPHESYPEEAKNRKLWTLYQNAGFEEHSDTRVLFYNTDYVIQCAEDYEDDE